MEYLKLSINTRIINKNELDDKKAFSTGWENVEVTPKELTGLINRGYAFSAQFDQGKRNTANFSCSDIIAVDIDETMTLEEAKENHFIQSFGTILYTTPSHTPETHRFRVIFALPRTIVSGSEMGWALAGLGKKLGGDSKIKDAARLFYGSKNSHPQIIGKELSEEALLELVELGKTPVVSDVSSSPGSIAANRSTLFLEPDHKLIDGSGQVRTLDSVEARLPVCCPFHIDKNPSAFTVKSRFGSIGVHCTVCQTTFWPKTNKLSNYDFFEFDQVVKRLATEEVTEWWLNNPDNVLVYDTPVSDDLSSRVIDEKHLSPISLKSGVTFIKSPKGTGKTELLKHIIEECRAKKLKVLMIGHRQSLLQASAERLGIHCYLDDGGDQRSAKSSHPQFYAVSLDSLSSRLNPKIHKYHVVIIDESEQVLSHWTSPASVDTL